MPVVFDQSYPPNTVEFSGIIRALKAAKPDIVYVASYPPDSAGILRAINEIGIGDNVKLFGGGMVGLQFGCRDGEHGLAAQRRRQLQHLAAGKEHVLSTAPRRSSTPTRSAPCSQGRSARLLSGAVRLRHRARLIEQAVKATRSLDQKAHGEIPARERGQDHRRADRVCRGRRAQGNRDADGAVPRHRGQEHRAVPQPGKQVILFPADLKSGDLVTPFEAARK